MAIQLGVQDVYWCIICSIDSAVPRRSSITSEDISSRYFSIASSRAIIKGLRVVPEAPPSSKAASIYPISFRRISLFVLAHRLSLAKRRFSCSVKWLGRWPEASLFYRYRMSDRYRMSHHLRCAIVGTARTVSIHISSAPGGTATLGGAAFLSDGKVMNCSWSFHSSAREDPLPK